MCPSPHSQRHLHSEPSDFIFSQDQVLLYHVSALLHPAHWLTMLRHCVDPSFLILTGKTSTFIPLSVSGIFPETVLAFEFQRLTEPWLGISDLMRWLVTVSLLYRIPPCCIQTRRSSLSPIMVHIPLHFHSPVQAGHP